MCDYCDCRSHPEIARLSSDHERVQGLLLALQRSVDAGLHEPARLVAARLRDVLELHADREERGVFEALRDADVEPGYLDAFAHDHDEIHALLAHIDGADWRERARELIRVLGDHIAREERDLFPAAHQLLTPHQWAAAHAAIALDLDLEGTR